MIKNILNDYLLNLEQPLVLSSVQLDQMELYYEHLVKISAITNLTAIKDQEGILIKHFVDSFIYLTLTLENIPLVNRVLDLGTGAGLPGIPLAILKPDLKVDLLDASMKKVNFLNEVINLLGLTNVRAFHERAEDLAHQKDFRESYDLVLARAVSFLPTLSEYLLPFVKKEGFCAITKECPLDEELEKSLRSIRLLGGEISLTKYYTLPVFLNKRAVLFIKKIKRTKNIYPRKAGTPQKNPL